MEQVTPGPKGLTRLTSGAWLFVLAVVGAVTVGGPWLTTQLLAAGHTFTAEKVPAKDVALVLGAGVHPNGTPSDYLRARLDLGYELYRSGKVRAVLVSGDNGEKHYNEPDVMRNYLIARGIPAKQVVADYAGFDTYASCVRADKVFGVTSMIVVSQSYHLPRALTICRAIGIEAVGVGDTSVRDASFETWRSGELREIGADLKMVRDLVTNHQPLLGPRETSIDEALAR